MTTVEEQIWDYIDGNCSTEEQLTIAAKIAGDSHYKAVYNELSLLNEQINGIELDEPSMAFNRNIMELVKLEAAPVSLKTKLNHKIIYSIAALFILMGLAVLGYSISQVNFTASKPVFTLEITRYITPAVIKAFVFADIIICFLFLDSLLRRKKQIS